MNIITFFNAGEKQIVANEFAKKFIFMSQYCDVIMLAASIPWSGTFVIVGISSKHATKISLAKHHNMVKAGNIGARPNFKNLWSGWGIDPAAGECTVVVDHIHEVIAAGDDSKPNYFRIVSRA